MKSTFLAVVVICALAIAGIGGTFASWGDSETSMNNEIVTGSVDLKVNDADDLPWGTGVPSKVNITCMVPCKWYGPFPVDLWNAGECEFPSACFIHFKDACCGNAPPKAGSGYPADYGINAGQMKPEPELVAEAGGKVNCITVPGIGETGDECSMLSHVEVVIRDEAGYALVGPVPLVDILSDEIYICDLKPCEPVTIYMWFHLLQESEEDYGYNFFPNEGETGYDPLEYAKFNDWPSWAMMRDKVVFNVEFDLYLPDPPEGTPGG